MVKNAGFCFINSSIKFRNFFCLFCFKKKDIARFNTRYLKHDNYRAIFWLRCEYQELKTFGEVSIITLDHEIQALSKQSSASVLYGFCLMMEVLDYEFPLKIAIILL